MIEVDIIRDDRACIASISELLRRKNYRRTRLIIKDKFGSAYRLARNRHTGVYYLIDEGNEAFDLSYEIRCERDALQLVSMNYTIKYMDDE